MAQLLLLTLMLAWWCCYGGGGAAVATTVAESGSSSSSRRTFRLSPAAQRQLDQLRRASPMRAQMKPNEEQIEAASGLPSDFDARQRWPHCIHGVLDQGDCGSCWAFAATEVLSDRLCIASSSRNETMLDDATINVILSPQDLLACEDANLGCAMGSPPDLAWRHLVGYGVRSLDCVPYVSGSGGAVPACSKAGQCANASCANSREFFARNYYHVGSFLEPAKHVEAIMQEIFRNGPVDTTFDVWGDFMGYAGGVYRHRTGGYEGLHSVKIIGWGAEKEEASGQLTPYWLVQNSWGKDWGPYNGFFKILRGQDECFIEAAIYAGLPRL